MANSSDDLLDHLIKQARLKAERELAEVQAAKAAKRKEANDLVASIYDDASEIALQGIEIGLDRETCKQISAALKLQALILRGDIHE